MDPGMGMPQDGPMGGDPGMMDGAPMDGQGMEPQVSSDDEEILNLLDQLGLEDKNAAKKYIESMVDRDGDGITDEMGVPGAPEGQGQEPPMMESVIFTKGQLDMIHESIRPSMDDDEDDSVNEKEPQKKQKQLNRKSPFNNPNFK